MTIAFNTKRVAILALSLVFAITAFLPVLVRANADSTPVSDNGVVPKLFDQGSGGNATCSDVGTYDNSSNRFDEGDQFEGTAGPITWSTSDDTYVSWSGNHDGLAVIVKGGDGSNVYYYSAATTSDSGLASPPKNDNTPELSNITFCWNDEDEEPEEYFFQFDKDWDGDVEEVDLDALEVAFFVDGKLFWTLGVDGPVPVIPGETTLTNVKEVVTGLPAQCTSTADVLPAETLTAPEDENDVYGEDNTFTLVVTNTIECEDDTTVDDDDNGVVAGDTDKKVDDKAVLASRTVRSLPETGSNSAVIAAGVVTAVSTVLAMFSTALKSAFVRITG
jgi:hypothetical protein